MKDPTRAIKSLIKLLATLKCMQNIQAVSTRAFIKYHLVSLLTPRLLKMTHFVVF